MARRRNRRRQIGPQLPPRQGPQNNPALKKKKKKGVWDKIKGGVSGIAGIAGELAPLLALAPALLARHPCMAGTSLAQTQAIAAPAAYGGVAAAATKFSARQEGRALVVTSEDVVQQVTISEEGVQAGDVIAAVNLDPYGSGFAGTRIQNIARTYQQYKIRQATVLFVPSAPTSAVGSLVMFTTTDPDESFQVAGFTAVQSALSHEGATQFPVWQPSAASYAPVPDRTFYSSTNSSNTDDADEVGLELRQTSAGQIAVVAAVDLTGYTDGVNSYFNYGELIVCWEIEFYNPSLDNNGLSEGWSGSPTEEQLATLSDAFPFGTSSGSDGLAGWSDPVDVEIPPAENSLPLRMDATGSASRLFGLTAGYYLAATYVTSITDSVSAPSQVGAIDSEEPQAFGNYENILAFDLTVLGTPNKHLFLQYFRVLAPSNDVDDGWFLPWQLSGGATYVGGSAQLVVARQGDLIQAVDIPAFMGGLAIRSARRRQRDMIRLRSLLANMNALSLDCKGKRTPISFSGLSSCSLPARMTPGPPMSPVVTGAVTHKPTALVERKKK